jgi:glycosyltransferase involved in cell wall biosynthesis
MKILIVHNAYQQRGGEDTVVNAELALLRAYGHEVEFYCRSNNELRDMLPLKAAGAAFWNASAARQIDRLCATFKPDLIHVHNTFPLISPAFFQSAARRHIPLVQTLHNFRLLCPQGMLLREGKICRDCIGKPPWRAITHRCYRASLSQSAVAAGVLALHRQRGTYAQHVTRFIALNTFCRETFIRGGLPAERLSIKPHFVRAPAPVAEDAPRTGGLFVGRLSAEKGIEVLCDAMATLPEQGLQIIGDGPLAPQVIACFSEHCLGTQSPAAVLRLLQRAAWLVAPSICYETFGMSIIEAFACGTPVIASAHGAYAELVRDGVNGLLFTPGDARDLARKIEWATAHPAHMRRMGQSARQEYELHYTPQRNHDLLMGIYEQAIEARQRHPHAAPIC